MLLRASSIPAIVGVNMAMTGHPFDFSWLHGGRGVSFLIVIAIVLVLCLASNKDK